MCLFYFDDKAVYFTLQYLGARKWVYRNLVVDDPGLLPATCMLVDFSRKNDPPVAQLEAYCVTGKVEKNGKMVTDAYRNKTVGEIVAGHEPACPTRVDPGDDWLAGMPKKTK